MRYIAAGLTVLALTACGTTTVTPAPTVTVTQPAAPVAEPTISDDEVNTAAAHVVWNRLTASDKADVCRAWVLAPAESEAAFKRGVDDPASADGLWVALVAILVEEC